MYLSRWETHTKLLKYPERHFIYFWAKLWILSWFVDINLKLQVYQFWGYLDKLNSSYLVLNLTDKHVKTDFFSIFSQRMMICDINIKTGVRVEQCYKLTNIYKKSYFQFDSKFKNAKITVIKNMSLLLPRYQWFRPYCIN